MFNTITSTIVTLIVAGLILAVPIHSVFVAFEANQVVEQKAQGSQAELQSLITKMDGLRGVPQK